MCSFYRMTEMNRREAVKIRFVNCEAEDLVGFLGVDFLLPVFYLPVFLENMIFHSADLIAKVAF
ncbi:MAG: hypothetical protein HDR55_07345 [Treponema sp.]|nr:hypothetical protein [Treponema sp.]